MFDPSKDNALAVRDAPAVRSGDKFSRAWITAPGSDFDFSGVHVSSQDYSAEFPTDDFYPLRVGDPFDVLEGRYQGTYVVRSVSLKDDSEFTLATLGRRPGG